MRRWILTLCATTVLATACDEGTLIEPEDPEALTASVPLEALIDPAAAPARRSLDPSLALLGSMAAVEGEAAECVTVDFESTLNMDPVGTPAGAPGVTFGTSWIALVDSDDGGDGPIANEPSAITVALTLDDVDADITLAEPAATVSLWYSATNSALPLTLEGLDGDGQVVAAVVGTTVGYEPDGAPCTGDPNGSYCLWEQLELDAGDAVIETVRVTSVPMVFAIDDLTVCGADEDAAGDGDGALSIDIKPGNDLNPINPKSNGKVKVALFSTEELDVTGLDIGTITLGDGDDGDTPVARKGGDRPMAQTLDMNGDGLPDLMLHFDVGAMVQNGDLDWDTEQLTLTAAAPEAEEEGEEAGDGETGSVGGATASAAEGDGETEGDDGAEGEEVGEALTGTDAVTIVGDAGDDEGEEEGEAGDSEDDSEDEDSDEDSDAGAKGKGKKKGHDKTR